MWFGLQRSPMLRYFVLPKSWWKCYQIFFQARCYHVMILFYIALDGRWLQVWPAKNGSDHGFAVVLKCGPLFRSFYFLFNLWDILITNVMCICFSDISLTLGIRCRLYLLLLMGYWPAWQWNSSSSTGKDQFYIKEEFDKILRKFCFSTMYTAIEDCNQVNSAAR